MQHISKPSDKLARVDSLL